MTPGSPNIHDKLDKHMNLHFTSTLRCAGATPYDLSKENMNGACKELVTALNFDCVISDVDVLRAHSSTPWSPAPACQAPAMVVTPRSTSEVSEIMKICSRRQIPVTSYSGGTSFSGALTATRQGICIDFKHMDKILAIHEEDLDVVVQPAVGWQELNTQLEPRGLFFPPDPGPGAKIGGMVSYVYPASSWRYLLF